MTGGPGGEPVGSGLGGAQGGGQSSELGGGPSVGLIVGPKTVRKAMGRPKVKRMIAGESKRHVAKAQALLNNCEIAPVRGTGSQSCSQSEPGEPT